MGEWSQGRILNRFSRDQEVVDTVGGRLWCRSCSPRHSPRAVRGTHAGAPGQPQRRAAVVSLCEFGGCVGWWALAPCVDCLLADSFHGRPVWLTLPQLVTTILVVAAGTPPFVALIPLIGIAV